MRNNSPCPLATIAVIKAVFFIGSIARIEQAGRPRRNLRARTKLIYPYLEPRLIGNMLVPRRHSDVTAARCDDRYSRN